MQAIPTLDIKTDIDRGFLIEKALALALTLTLALALAIALALVFSS
jgi:hypothetical protein